MKNLSLILLLLSLAFTAVAQTPKQDTTYKAKVYDARIYRYLAATPKSEQGNLYAFADSTKAKKAEKAKKKAGK